VHTYINIYIYQLKYYMHIKVSIVINIFTYYVYNTYIFRTHLTNATLRVAIIGEYRGRLYGAVITTQK